MTDEAGSVLAAGNPAGDTPAGDAGGEKWYGSLDADLAQWVEAKGLPDVPTALSSYRNLEKLLGADKAGRAVVPPREDAPAEEWSAFYDRLGRPAADKYELPVPEGDSGEFAKQAAEWFHEAGLTARQAQVLASKWNELQGGTQQREAEEYAAASLRDIDSLRREWGDRFEANAELARRARREAGLSDEDGRAIERALGVGKAAQVFAKLGQQFAEAPLRGTSEPRASFGTTPEAAKGRIAALRSDASFAARLVNGDADAKAEWDRLHAIAFAAA